MGTLTGRSAVVTGGAKGIGAGIARSLAAAGARVVVNYVSDAEAAGRVVAGIEHAGGRAIAVPADIRRPDDVERLIGTAESTFGVPDVLVNNAGVYGFGPLEAMTPEEFHRQIDTNLLGPFLTMQAFAGRARPGASVVNIATAGISTTPPYTSLYTATKAALAAATSVLAKELAPRGIRVNAIAASPSDTHGTRAMGFVGSPAEAEAVAGIPLGRLGVPEDVGPVVAFLASDDARWITGDVIFASGGQH
ncbi:glucose 1-dehydrogenase [Jidongwangia harbinensis]|uniref:glucose 1-dehydrogenase n=1 Tax=Jidongwangia harbinensis TaxID=2878561 RepID=UPI001CD93B95|nr:glucose 1-dehydrogenase [Jidongwangia harbinensis]MCA2212304.1 glucose 1-dehydrogenase [Jidongwangia harbinensis]